MTHAKRRLQVETTELACIENDYCPQLLEEYEKSEMTRDRWSVQIIVSAGSQLSHTLRMVERSTSLFLRPYFDSSQTVEEHVSREGARCSHTLNGAAV